MPDTAEREIPVETITVPSRVWHRYPGGPMYRLSGASDAQPGDIALCGWRKGNGGRTGEAGVAPPGYSLCVVCEDLAHAS